MAFQIVALKKGRSTVDLAKEFGVIQPTAWFFKSKLQKAMRTGHSEEEEKAIVKAKFSLDSIIITHRGVDLNGLQRIDLELCSMTKEDEPSKEPISSYCILPHQDGLERSRLVRGKFHEFKTSILLWNFKVWLTGIHHHCSFTYLKGYLDEFFFKYNHRNEPQKMWHMLLLSSIKGSSNIRRSEA